MKRPALFFRSSTLLALPVWVSVLLLFPCAVQELNAGPADKIIDPIKLKTAQEPQQTLTVMCDVMLVPGDDIQLAIDVAAPGDVICLEAGYYPVFDTIYIDKPLVLSGNQRGVDPRPSQGTSRSAGSPSETILDGLGVVDTIIDIAADNVMIEGLEIMNGTGDMVASSLDDPVKWTPIVRQNIIHDTWGDEGVQLRNTQDALIENNYIFNTTGDGINVCCKSSSATIRGNELTAINSPDAAIYVYQLYNDAPMLVTIANNLVYGVYRADGIRVGAKNGQDVGVIGGTVRENHISSTVQDSININCDNNTVNYNFIEYSDSPDAAIYIKHNVDVISVNHNLIRYSGPTAGGPVTYAVRIGDETLGYFPRNVIVTKNCFEDNEGGLYFAYDGTFILDATHNYWGDPSGPSGAGPGAGDSVDDNVQYRPFWNNCPF